MLHNKGLIGLSCAMMAAGLAGTLAVMAHVLPMPALAPPGPADSRFVNAFVAKDQLLIAYQWTRLYVLRTVPPSTVIGRDGWLYYRSEAANDGNSIDDFMGRVTPAPPTLALWKKTLVERRESLARQNIRYLAFVAPNAVTIYPEHLPPEIGGAHRRTRSQAVFETMPEEVLDLSPTLTERKPLENVYDSSDTHWNDLGAFAAYEAVTARLGVWFPAIQPIQRADMNVVAARRLREISYGLHVPGTPLPTAYLDARRAFGSRCADTGEIVLAPGSIRDVTQINARARNWVWIDSSCPSRRFVQDDPSLPKAVIFHDSFMMALNPFLSQDFREVVYVLGRFDPAVIEREKPDVVIDEITERHLDHLF